MSDTVNLELSGAQLEILSDPRPRGLVAAGAGSGKTRLLVAYFVRALLEERMQLEDIAAVTFTRKAGSELAARIRRALEDCGHPELARDIDRASIGTIHSLCARMLRAQPLRAGIDPSFAVLEDDVASLIREEVSRLAWDRVVEDASDDELEVMASRGEALRKQVVVVYERLRGMGREAPQVHIERGPGEAAARAVLLHACREAVSGARLHCKGGSALDDDLERIATCIDWLERTVEAEETVGGGGRPATVVTNGFFPSRRTKAAEPWFAPVREALAGYRCALAERELGPLVSVTNRLLTLFHQEYTGYKDARGVLDFADLELRATAMLDRREEGGSGLRAAPTGMRTATVSRLLVDEFQDTNEVQCALLDGLGAERVLMVGDERQSIYRFRGADVDVFRRRKEAPDLAQHRLDTNYRSRPEVVDFINRLFSSEGFFGSDGFDSLASGRDLEADPPVGRDPLRSSLPGAGPSGGDPGPDPLRDSWISEVLVADRPVPAAGQEEAPAFHEAEARAVASRIRRLIDEEGFSQGDIVVLLPVLSNVGLFQEALLAQGLDIYVVRGKGYYSQDEVADVAALLRLLVDPHDDLSLVTVLRSPLVGVSDDCLYLVGGVARESRARSLWEVVREGDVVGLDPGDRARLGEFAVRLDGLRARVGRPGLSRLIDDAVTTCDYDLCLLAAPQGKRRFANIRKLMRMASDYEALEGPNLAGFVALIGSLNELGDSEGNAPSLAEGEDVVRVMTVHQAKGLEFPAVFLAGLGSPGRHSTTDEFVLGQDGRMAALVRQRQDAYEECHPHWGPAPDIIADEKRHEEEEDVRLLYVAMTRAKDRLLLVGARPKGDKFEGTPIGRIVGALGLDSFPDSGAAVAVDGLRAAVVGVPYLQGELGERGGRDELPSATCVEGQAPEPVCFLSLERPGSAPRQVSFSTLSAYHRCPRRFYLERLLGLAPLQGRAAADEDDVVTGRDDALLDEIESDTGRDVGLLVHSLLEQIDLWGERPTPDALSAQAEEGATAAGLALSGDGIRRAADLVAAFWDSPVAGHPDLASSLREEEFVFVHADMTVRGVMDLLCRSEEGWRIVDYKSNALNGRAPGQVAEGYGLQADLYCLAALRAGAPAVRMEFLFLEKAEEPVIFEYGFEDREQLEGRLEEALAGIGRGAFPLAAGAICVDCGVADLCASMARS